MNNATFSSSDIYQFIGFIGVLITILIGVIQRDRDKQNQIFHLKELFHIELNKSRERCDKEISEIREEFVKKVDLEKHLMQVEKNIERIHTRLDDILQRLMAGT